MQVLWSLMTWLGWRSFCEPSLSIRYVVCLFWHVSVTHSDSGPKGEDYTLKAIK